jgi:tetratricopeptide (TPR) repeat protein
MFHTARSTRLLACLLIAAAAPTVDSQSSSANAAATPAAATPGAPAPATTRSSAAATADPYDSARRLLLAGKYAEAADALAKLAETNPYDGWIWGNWGYCVHALKRYDEAIALFLKAAELDGDRAGYIYNIACAQSLMGHKDEAFAWLEKALDARFVNQETLETDTDLDPLRDDPRFARLTGITRLLKAPLVASRDEGWRWDLEFYARRMKQMHWDLYGKVSEKEFHTELDRLAHDVPGLTDEQARLRLRKITALVGDGHTSCALAAEGAATLKRLPLQLYSFKEGLYVIGASKEHESLIGSKVLKVGSLDTGAALLSTTTWATSAALPTS